MHAGRLRTFRDGVKGRAMTVSTPGRPSIARYHASPVQAFLHQAARRWPRKIAVIDGDRRFTFSELDARSTRLAAALVTLGVAKGDCVGLLAPNCAEFVIAFYGVVTAGAVVSTINSGYREMEVAHQLLDSGAQTLIVHETLLETARSACRDVPLLRRLIVIGDASGTDESFWGLIHSANVVPPDVDIDPKDDLAALPYSSGTTGLSKGVMLTHFNLTANVQQWLEREDEVAHMGHNDIILVHPPLFHIYGMNVLMNQAVAVGATLVMMGRFQMDRFLTLISTHSVTALFTVPPVALGLVNFPRLGDYDLSALRFALLGAAPMSADLQRQLQAVLGCPVIQGYGMTELSPVSHIDYAEPELGCPGSVGFPVADTEAKVVDLETGESEVSFGEPGELLVRGPQVMKGYYNNPAATAEAITPDGWLHTGDIVRMDADGRVWVVDRKKELIKYKGFQVPPAELEGLLFQHPGVMDAAVIGKADADAGEVPKAFVVRTEGADVTGDDLMAFVAGKVATFKQVREVEFVESIPKNPSGKILRRVLLEQERASS